jgi:hypothetical protein
MTKDRAPPNRMTNVDPLASKIRVFFNGAERFDVLDYNIREGWVTQRVYSGYGRFRKALPRKMYGTVTVTWK